MVTIVNCDGKGPQSLRLFDESKSLDEYERLKRDENVESERIKGQLDRLYDKYQWIRLRKLRMVTYIR